MLEEDDLLLNRIAIVHMYNEIEGSFFTVQAF